jgi:hypothetical protein
VSFNNLRIVSVPTCGSWLINSRIAGVLKLLFWRQNYYDTHKTKTKEREALRTVREGSGHARSSPIVIDDAENSAASSKAQESLVKDSHQVAG